MVRSIDHIVIAVRNLAEASANYENAGFTVIPGGEHVGGATHNALISFADGAYFELIAFKDPDKPQEHRWWKQLAAGEGLVDFALLSNSLIEEAVLLRDAGLQAAALRDGGRLRPDGQQVAWRMFGPAGPSGTRLPFVIEDVTPRELRVPGGPAINHAIGVTHVAGVTVAVADLAQSAPAYAALLGAEGSPSRSAVEGVADALRYPIGDQWIEIAQPNDSATDILNHINTRGDVPYEIVLAGAASATGHLLPLTTTHNTRLRIVP